MTSTGEVGVTASDGHEITGGSILLVLADQLGNTSGWPALAAALAAARTGDADPVAALLTAPLGIENPGRQLSGAVVYRCNDSAQRLGGTALGAAASAARAAAPNFGSFAVGEVGICGSWPAPEAALGPVTASGAPPILVVGAADDPLSPFVEVRSLTAQLDSAVLLTWQSGTHGAYPASSCVTAVVDAYLLAGTLPAVGTLCPP